MIPGRSFAFGAHRDYLIGISLIQPDGRVDEV
jgi:hypothetical protein